MRSAKAWQIVFSAAAERDFDQVVRWTAREFGGRQAISYARTLSMALEALAAGPDVVGARRRDDIAPGLCSLHVGRGGRRGRHVVLFRVRPSPEVRAIEVLRVLHDAMDLQRHVPPPEDDQ